MPDDFKHGDVKQDSYNPNDSSHAQMAASSYRLPVEDLDFLLRDEMRSLRFAFEYQKADLYLRDWGIRSTIVVFGSARILAPEIAAAQLALATTDEAQAEAQMRMQQSRWYTIARQFGRIVSERGGAIHPLEAGTKIRDNVIATGGGPGIMAAANQGANDVGAPSIGFNITLPHEQRPNPYSTPDLTFRFHYFAMRKMHLAMRANALAVFPGGFGTMDEMFEILTLLQTHKAPPLPVLLFDRAFWSQVINFDLLVAEGLVNRRDLDLFKMVDTAEQGWSALRTHGLVAHTPEVGQPGA
jgi:uncharacterized protein (TIGR00730 family)